MCALGTLIFTNFHLSQEFSDFIPVVSQPQNILDTKPYTELFFFLHPLSLEEDSKKLSVNSGDF